MPVYSVVIPCYNEEAVIGETHKRLTAVMQGMDGDYELIYVNDGSRDNTARLLNALAEGDGCVRVIHFAANRGHQIAVTAGLDYAAGEAVIIIDADLQDPPEVIPQMAEKWRGGAQVVYGQRNRRAGESAFKKATAHMFYRFLRKMTNVDIPADTGDFRLVDRRVADAVCDMPEHARYLRGMFAWVGFRQEAVRYDRDKRFAGETHYPLHKMIRLALDGLLGFSDRPLRWITLLGIFCASGGAMWLLGLAVLALFGISDGFVWLIAFIDLCTGCILIGMGILGAYIQRIYDETRARPLYHVADKRGFPAGE